MELLGRRLSSRRLFVNGGESFVIRRLSSRMRKAPAKSRGSDMRLFSLLGLRLLAVAAAIVLIGLSGASARPHHRTAPRTVAAPICFLFCEGASAGETRTTARAARRQARREAAQQRAALRQQAAVTRHQSAFGEDEAPRQKIAETIIGGRPPGCPQQFCGCGASLEVFGKIIPRLNRAAQWFLEFRRVAHADATSGMVAGNTSHVFVLLRHIAGDDWLVKNYNGRGHRTSIQRRRLTHYTVVDPHNRRYASAE